MLKKIFLLVMLAIAPAAGQTTTGSLYPYGAWAVCVSGVAQSFGYSCDWYTPGTEMYMLEIAPSSSPAVTRYAYSIQAVLANGRAVRMEGEVAAHDDYSGYTIVAPLLFGGIVQPSTVVVHVYEISDNTGNSLPLSPPHRRAGAVKR
jgi:hypothetical protein